MSQNRESKKDRAQAETDSVNLKNAVGIETLVQLTAFRAESTKRLEVLERLATKDRLRARSRARTRAAESEGVTSTRLAETILHHLPACPMRRLALALILLGCGARSSLRSGDSGVTEGDADVDALTDDAPDDDGGTIADAPGRGWGHAGPRAEGSEALSSTSTESSSTTIRRAPRGADVDDPQLPSLIDGPGRPEGLGVLGTRLFVGFSAPHVPVIAIFDHADTIVGAAAPSGQITASDVFNGARRRSGSSADPASDTLWAHSSCCGHPGTSCFATPRR